MLLRHSLVVFIIMALISHKVSATEQTLNINDVNWPPYFFIDNDTKEYTLGIGKEVLNYCLTKSGYNTNYIRLPVKRTHHYMKEGILDITVYSYKKSREEILHYASEPIFNSEYGFLVRADSKIKINNLDDILPYQIGHLDGLTYTPEYMEIVNQKLLLDEVTVAHNLKAMFAQLLAPKPRFDIMADSKATFHWFAKNEGVSNKIKVLDYSLKNKDYFITVSKKSKNISDPKALLKAMDSCLIDMKQDGNYQKILTKYGQ
jgi:polar amino acid transport system substrate-binding protein